MQLKTLLHSNTTHPPTPCVGDVIFQLSNTMTAKCDKRPLRNNEKYDTNKLTKLSVHSRNFSVTLNINYLKHNTCPSSINYDSTVCDTDDFTPSVTRVKVEHMKETVQCASNLLCPSKTSCKLYSEAGNVLIVRNYR